MSGLLKTFVHPQKAYRLEFPAEWENLVQDEGRSCGFGPRDRNDVGLWISIIPATLDTDQFNAELPKLFEQSLRKADATNLRRDENLKHHAMKADATTDGQGGHYWLLAGGDLVLFASSQVPVAEREVWNPPFEKLMASLKITRDDELLMHQIGCDILERLQQLHPDQEYRWDKDGLRGKDNVVFLSNVFRDVRRTPDRRDEIVERFVQNLIVTPGDMGHESWYDAQDAIVPVLKPKAYIKPEGPTRHLQTTEWLADVLICYAIQADKAFRFVTGWDCDRWGIDGQRLHEVAIFNLEGLAWPSMMHGSSDPSSGGRLVLVQTDDSFSASRLLHPEFHKLFSKNLGSPFLAGIPDRDTLVAFSNREALKKRIARQVKKDYNASSYPITPRLFLVTADGIALASK